jgi:hypothetical protein
MRRGPGLRATDGERRSESGADNDEPGQAERKPFDHSETLGSRPGPVQRGLTWGLG